MAKGFKRKGRGATATFVATLDDAERGVIVGLLEQTRDLIDESYADRDGAPPEPHPGTGDADFDAIVSGLGGMGQGVSVAAEDQTDLGVSDDPAIARLFPTANRVDEEAAAQFRAMTQDGLRQRKLANLRTAITALSGEDKRVRLGRPEATALMVALTDVRLVLAERIGITTEDDSERLRELAASADPDDPVAYASAIYDFLSWVQEGLAEALLP